VHFYHIPSFLRAIFPTLISWLGSHALESCESDWHTFFFCLIQSTFAFNYWHSCDDIYWSIFTSYWHGWRWRQKNGDITTPTIQLCLAVLLILWRSLECLLSGGHHENEQYGGT
jgi:hypothetical protein